ncbi:MAG: Glycosyl transferase, WecB/TagA/CpsF family [candidate division WWE3 bacterium GW2011_GWE1_41_27]|uniref:Glycosyl transferase, WecB/TagA/CpsF family n=1 Tax=candidate division WWE3 bacterium GW2011_GWE1_41_27 TaxID=1619131 RepID=A0A0G0W0H9_UNCKA|nr:MAG: Glycosyl transferase, WecB/TagA/CpsF family [candidate division WWE3 bacterium GW2011_GWE1_41_27]
MDMDCGIGAVMEKIESDLLQNGSHYICTTNPEFIMSAQKDPEFREMINNADLSLPDGSGVVMADYYLKKMSGIVGNSTYRFFAGLAAGLETALGSFSKTMKFAPKVTGVRLSEEIFKSSAAKRHSVFLLGGMVRDWKGELLVSGSEDIANIAAEKIRKDYPGVNVIGASSGFSYKEEDDERTLKYIKECMTRTGVEVLDFILVAYGHKKQEAWILRNISKIPCRIGVGVGGTFDYLSGVSRKPSDKITQVNMEWLFRLCTQPWRFSRIVRAFPLFPLRVFFSSLK